MNDSQASKLLFALEGIGAIFLGAFLLAYLMGLPTQTVYHSDPTLRMILSLFGGLLLVLALIALAVSIIKRRKD